MKKFHNFPLRYTKYFRKMLKISGERGKEREKSSFFLEMPKGTLGLIQY